MEKDQRRMFPAPRRAKYITIKHGRGPGSACSQDRELVAAMSFGYPGRLVAEALGQDDEIDDLGRVRAARDCDADPAHPVPPLMVPPLNIRCEARLNIVRAFEQIG